MVIINIFLYKIGIFMHRYLIVILFPNVEITLLQRDKITCLYAQKKQIFLFLKIKMLKII